MKEKTQVFTTQEKIEKLNRENRISFDAVFSLHTDKRKQSNPKSLESFKAILADVFFSAQKRGIRLIINRATREV